MAKVRVTKTGIVVVGVMIGLMVFAVSQEFLRPESELGKFVSTFGGRLMVFVFTAIAFYVVEGVLTAMGIKLFEKSESNDV